MRHGHELIGWGMATKTYPGKNLPASALVRLQPDGRILVAPGTQEIGTGNYTILTQIAAAALLVPSAIMDARLGDTGPPPAPISPGSMSTASVGPAVKAAAESARRQLIALAVADPRSPLCGARPEDVEFDGGKVARKSDPTKAKCSLRSCDATGISRWTRPPPPSLSLVPRHLAILSAPSLRKWPWMRIWG